MGGIINYTQCRCNDSNHQQYDGYNQSDILQHPQSFDDMQPPTAEIIAASMMTYIKHAMSSVICQSSHSILMVSVQLFPANLSACPSEE